VWSQSSKQGYNTLSIVVKTEDSNWITFLDTGTFGGGVEVLNTGGTKKENIKIAIKYMKENPRG